MVISSFALILFFLSTQASDVPDYCKDIFKYACDNQDRNKDKGAGTTDIEENRRKLNGVLGIAFPGYLNRLSTLAGKNKTWAKDFASQINGVVGEICQPDLSCLENNDVKYLMSRVYLRILNLEGTYADRPFHYDSTGKVALPAFNIDVTSIDNLLRNSEVRSNALKDRAFIMREMKVDLASQTLINEIVPQVRTAAIDYITSNLPSSQQKTRIIETVRKMKINVNQDALLSELVNPNASYTGDGNAVSYQGSMLIASDSIFMHAYLLAHEIAHSFDPCTFASGSTFTGTTTQEKKYPFLSVVQCLRSESYLNAHAFEDWRQRHYPHLNPNSPFTPRFSSEDPSFMQGLENFCKTPTPSDELRRSIHEHIPLQLTKKRFQAVLARCPNLKGYKYRQLIYRYTDDLNRTNDNAANKNTGSPNPSCSTEDEIGEAFSDWFAHQILPSLLEKLTKVKLTQQQYVNGMANLQWYDCGDSPVMLPSFGEHPPGKLRLQVATLHPVIRKKMGCPPHPELQHCPLSGKREGSSVPGKKENTDQKKSL